MTNNIKTITIIMYSWLLYWITNTLWDKFVLFPKVSMWTIFLRDAPNHSFYARPSDLLLIVMFSITTSVFLNNKIKTDQHYKELLENIDDAVLICGSLNSSSAKRFVEINEAACEMLGYSREEFLRLSPGNIIDPERIGDLSAIMELLRTEGQALFKTVFIKKDGAKAQVEVNAKLSQYKGESICLAMVRDVTVVHLAEKALRESEQQLRLVTDRLIGVREEERGRISKELHDELGQNLIYLKMQVSQIQSRLPNSCSDLDGECEKLLAHLDETIDNVRRLSQDLKPVALEKLGFSLAVDLLIEESTESFGAKARVDLDVIDDVLLPEAQLNLYRIIQESLTNIGKHAHATEVSMAIKEQPGQIFIRIQDNGRGFDPHQTPGKVGLGLSAIQERARLIDAELKIQSQRGQGTEIILTIPLNGIATSGAREPRNEPISHFIGRRPCFGSGRDQEHS